LAEKKIHKEIKLEFWTKLEAQLHLIISKTEEQRRFKVKQNNYWMNLHKN
jgi:hypothetical protein